MCDAVDINASGCDICGNENADPVRLEPLERSLTRRLRFIAVNGGSFYPGLTQLLGDPY